MAPYIVYSNGNFSRQEQLVNSLNRLLVDWILGIMLVIALPAAATPLHRDAHSLLDAATNAMGGASLLRDIERVHLRARVYRRLLAQSERPDGPWVPDFSDLDQHVNFERNDVRTRLADRQWGPPLETIVSGDVAIQVVYPQIKNRKTSAGRRKSVRAADVRMALGPERVLLTALAAKDIHVEPLVYLQDVPQQVLAFTWRKAPVRLYLNAYTSLPTMVQITRPHPYDVFWNLWGDVTTRIYYSFWTLKADGLRYPRQWDIWRNGRPERTLLVNELEVNPPPVKPVSISAAEKRAFARKGAIDNYPMGDHAQKVAPGIVLIPGPWNTSLIVQPDGIIILEAPISSGYSAAVVTAAEKRFPSRRIKAVVTTSNAWPHVGGIREYVARGVPLYVLDLNVPFIEQVLIAPHTMRPDTLAEHPHAPRLHVVSAKTVIGSGANRIELYPVRGEAGERMMLAYFPERHLLYASDLVQPKSDGGFAFPEYLREVTKAVSSYGLRVDKVFGMHTAHVLRWQAIQKAARSF